MNLDGECCVVVNPKGMAVIFGEISQACAIDGLPILVVEATNNRGEVVRLGFSVPAAQTLRYLIKKFIAHAKRQQNEPGPGADEDGEGLCQ